MVTDRVIQQLNDVYYELGKLVNLVGLKYEDDEYICTNKNQVDNDWCDREMLESIENAYENIGYFLGKR